MNKIFIVSDDDLINIDVIERAMSAIPVKHEPYVDDEGIWYPCKKYTSEGMGTNYKLVISKEMFIEAYNKWIKGE